MTHYDNMELLDYNIEINGVQKPEPAHVVRLDELKYAIRHSWMAEKRKQISSIYPSNKYDGSVFAVDFEDEKPPTIGGFAQSIARYGWGYLAFDEKVLYVSQIIQTEDGFRFENRDKDFDLSYIQQVPKVSVYDDGYSYNSMEDEQVMRTIRDELQKVWPKKTLDTIKHITPVNGDPNTCRIVINNKTERGDEKENKSNTNQKVPDVPVGKHIDVLLRLGWGLSAVKGHHMYISRIKRLSQNKETNFRSSRNYMLGDSPDHNEIMYTPRLCQLPTAEADGLPRCYRCEQCEKREGSRHVVVSEREYNLGKNTENPETSKFCERCYQKTKEKYPTIEEYKQTDNPQIPSTDDN